MGDKREGNSWYGSGPTHREEGVDDVSLDGAERLVSDDHEDLLLLLQADEVAEPRLLRQPGETQHTREKKRTQITHIHVLSLVSKRSQRGLTLAAAIMVSCIVLIYIRHVDTV